jgi:hypothetical protein
MSNPIEDLPDWVQLLFADFLSRENKNEETIFYCSTKLDAQKAFQMMERAYVAGYRDRTKQLRAVPKLRDPYPPLPEAKPPRRGPPPLPTEGPYHKGR